MELTEEWDQYEKKIKDVYGWINKSRATFESPKYKNRPLRDQLVYLEKTLADIMSQKTKITISFEKLQVYNKNLFFFYYVFFALIRFFTRRFAKALEVCRIFLFNFFFFPLSTLGALPN